MKKLLILACILFLLTGCAEKTSIISCSREENSTKIVFNITYNDSKKIATVGEIQMILDFSSQTDEQFEVIKTQDFCSMVLPNLNSKEEMYSNCRPSVDGKTITLVFDLDLAKLESFENGLFKANMSKEEIISYFEKQDATCKIGKFE